MMSQPNPIDTQFINWCTESIQWWKYFLHSNVFWFGIIGPVCAIQMYLDTRDMLRKRKLNAKTN